MRKNTFFNEIPEETAANGAEIYHRYRSKLNDESLKYLIDKAQSAKREYYKSKTIFQISKFMELNPSNIVDEVIDEKANVPIGTTKRIFDYENVIFEEVLMVAIVLRDEHNFNPGPFEEDVQMNIFDYEAIAKIINSGDYYLVEKPDEPIEVRERVARERYIAENVTIAMADWLFENEKRFDFSKAEREAEVSLGTIKRIKNREKIGFHELKRIVKYVENWHGFPCPELANENNCLINYN